MSPQTKVTRLIREHLIAEGYRVQQALPLEQRHGE